MNRLYTLVFALLFSTTVLANTNKFSAVVIPHGSGIPKITLPTNNWNAAYNWMTNNSSNATFYTVTMSNGVVLGTNFVEQLAVGTNRPIAGQVIMDEFSILDSGYAAVAGSLTPTSSIIPTVSNAYDLGSSNFPFRELYLGTNSITMGGQKVLSYNPSSSSLVSQVPLDYTPPGATSGVNYVTNGAPISVLRNDVGYLHDIYDQIDYFTLVPAGSKVKVADRIEAKADLALFYRASDRSQSAYGLYNTWLDAFADQTGINLGLSTGQTYVAAGSYYWNMSGSGASAPGYCLTFDGVDDGLGCGDNDVLGPEGATATWTVSCWYTNNGDYQILLWQAGDTANKQTHLSHNWQGANWVFMLGNPSTAYGFASPNVSAAGWHHCVISYTGTTVNIYFDATNAYSNSSITTYTKTETGFRIARASSDARLNGKMDEVAIFNKALSASEVTNLYNSRAGAYVTAANWPSATHVWHLDDNTGTTAIDSVGTDTMSFVSSPVWTDSPVCSNVASASPTNMTLYAQTFPVINVPTNYRVVAYLENVSNVTLNTDFFLDATRDGTNWYTPTLANEGVYSNGAYIVSGTGTFSAVAHTNVAIRARTANNKVIKSHGWHIAVE